MSFQFWDPSTISTMFNGDAQNSSFPANVSAYFRRPARIVKSGSRNNSPRSNVRRRMTTTGHFPARTRSVVDNQRTTIPLYTQQHHQPLSRPISWHPNMMEDASPVHMSYQPMIDNFMMTPYDTTEVHGLVTPLSYPLMDEPQIQELIAPLEELSADDPNAQYRNEQDFSSTQYWPSQQNNKDARYDFGNGYVYPNINYQSWYANSQHQFDNVPTTPASPAYIPMPDFGDPLTVPSLELEVEKEDLVGMGLYDSPAEVQTSALLLSGDMSRARRKSLKLEDAFEPSPLSEDEEDDDYTEEDDQVLSHSTTDIHAVEMPQDLTLPSAEYSYIMNNHHFAMPQWPMESQTSYGWV